MKKVDCMDRVPKFMQLFISIMSICLGGLIYLGFRKETLLMFNWADLIGAQDLVQSWRDYCSNIMLPKWAIFSLPDGLWTLSYLLLIDLIWNDTNHDVRRTIFILFLPIIAIILEFGQLCGFVEGTFDIVDLFFYIAAFIMYYLLKNIVL